MKGRSPRDAGKELSVASVLTSSLTRSGNRLRVTASLANAATDDVLWSDTFDENDQDQFALQDRLVSAITGALKLNLSSETKVAVAAHGTRSAEAHDLVLRSNFLSDQFSGIYALVVPSKLRDSLYLLEGVLNQQTMLKPTEFMTDTAGSSDVIFGLFWLLGYQFLWRHLRRF